MAIVIVDDEVKIRESTRRLLEKAGMEVLGEAANGAEALALVASVKPVVVIMDGSMPLMDGATATRYLREMHPNLAVIAHTADPHLGEQMSKAGASEVVLKGSGAELLEAIRSAVPSASHGLLGGGPQSRLWGATQLRGALFRHARLHAEAFPPESVPGDDNDGWWLSDGSLAVRLTAIPRIAVKEGLNAWMRHLLELRDIGQIAADETGVTQIIDGTLVVVLLNPDRTASLNHPTTQRSLHDALLPSTRSAPGESPRVDQKEQRHAPPHVRRPFE